MLIPDLAPFFNQNEATVKKIIGDLTSAYDGTFSKATGTSGLLQHKAHFGVLGCTTPMDLGKYEKTFSQLGPRFLTYRVPPLSMEERTKAKQAVKAPGRGALRRQLTDLVSARLDGLRATADEAESISIDPDIDAEIDTLADFIGACRSHVVEGEVQAEGSLRALQQLRTLATALAFVRGASTVGQPEMTALNRIAMGSMPKIRATVLGLSRQEPDLTVERLVDLGLTDWTARSTLTDLALLGVYTTETLPGRGHEKLYRVAERFRCVVMPPEGGG